jgi:hypothetical protein
MLVGSCRRRGLGRAALRRAGKPPRPLRAADAPLPLIMRPDPCALTGAVSRVQSFRLVLRSRLLWVVCAVLAAISLVVSVVGVVWSLGVSVHSVYVSHRIPPAIPARQRLRGRLALTIASRAMVLASCAPFLSSRARPLRVWRAPYQPSRPIPRGGAEERLSRGLRRAHARSCDSDRSAFRYVADPWRSPLRLSAGRSTSAGALKPQRHAPCPQSHALEGHPPLEGQAARRAASANLRHPSGTRRATSPPSGARVRQLYPAQLATNHRIGDRRVPRHRGWRCAQLVAASASRRPHDQRRRKRDTAAGSIFF